MNKNIVLITVDCLRADHIGFHGYKLNTTPYLDEIAEKSLIFKNAFANGPNTRHSVPSFLTSTYPLLYNQEAEGGKLQSGRKVITEILKNYGYTTLGVHSNPYVSKFYGYDRGFDYFNDFLLGQVEKDIERNWLKKNINEFLKGLKTLIFHRLPHETGEKINEVVFKKIKNVKKPFFLWVHYMDVHMPYVPPDKYLKKLGLKTYGYTKKIWMGKKIDDIKKRKKIKDGEIKDYINLYDACICYTDKILEDLIKNIEKDHPETIFIITADHGEEFREHGDLSHMEKLYDELLHVPLIFYGKDIENNVVKKPVSLIDFAPTILTILGLDKEKMFQGEGFFESKKYVISEAWKDRRITSYRDKKWKFIIDGNKKELYNLEEDPLEKQNLSEKPIYNEKVQDFNLKIRQHINWLNSERKKRKKILHEEKIRDAIRRNKKI